MLGKFLEKSIPSNCVKTWQGKGIAYDQEFSLSYIVNRLNSFHSTGIVYYPSSGLDVTDIHYVNKKKIPEINIEIPNIYIHTDAMDYFTHLYDKLLNNPVYNWIEGYEWNDDENKRIYLNRFKRNGLDTDFWFIYFKCFCNENILKSFLANKIKVDIVFCPIDGITLGNGAEDRCENVPTLFYPLLSKHLGIKYIITDQSSKAIDYFSSENVSRWIKNINRLHKDIFITKTDVENLHLQTNEIIKSECGFYPYTIILKSF